MKEITNNLDSAKKTPFGVPKNFWFLIWSGAVSVANSVILWIFVARWRGADEFGGFTTAMGLYALFYNICSLGLAPFLVNEISRRAANCGGRKANDSAIENFVGSAAVFLFGSGIICAVLMTVSSFFLIDSTAIRTAAIILSFALVPTGVIVLAESAAISFGRGRLIAFVTTFENLVRTVVPLFLLWHNYSLVIICLSFVAVRFISLFIYLGAARKYLSLSIFEQTAFAALFKAAPTYAATIILASLNWQLPIILLARLSAETESARFGVASRFLIPAAIFAAGCANAMQPNLVAEYEKSSEAAISYLRKIAVYASLLTISSAVLSPFLSGAVLTILFGEKYADAALTLDLLAVGVVPFALTVIVARGLLLINAQRMDLIANAAGLLIGAIAGLVLIPRFGASGAAAAQALTYALTATVVVVYLSLNLKNFRLEKTDALHLSGIGG